MKKTRFLFALFLAIAMIAISPQRMWALGGSGTSSSPYTIASADDLKEFADIVNGTNGKTRNVAAWGKLTADINLGNAAWKAMGSSSYAYTGTFDGQGHKISGLSLTATADNAGFFGYVNGATIKNFTLAGSISSNSDNVGSVVGYAKGNSTIQDIVSTVNITMTAAKTHLGGIAGNIENATSVLGCTYSGTLNAGSSTDSNGGIVGFANANCSGTIKYCFFNGTVKTTGSGPQMGGILGYTNDESNNFGGVQNCYSCGTLTYSGSDTHVNAIVGRIRARATTTINNTYLSGIATRACNTDGPSIPTSNKAITISVTAGDNGSVSQSYVNPTSTTATKLHVEATPNTGYHFTKWSDNNTTTNRNDVALTDNVNLTASFGAHTYGNWITDKAATCTTSGTKHHVCTLAGCDAREDGTIAATGHGQTNGYTPTYTWSNDINAHTCSFSLKCKDCSANVVTNKSLTGTQTVHTDATCTREGSTTYQVTGSYNVSGSKTYSGNNSKTYTIAALGHGTTGYTPTYSWGGTYSAATCSFTLKCKKCSSNVVSNQALTPSKVPANHADATCTAVGNERWTATGNYSKSGDITYSGTAQTNDYAIPALGHDFTVESTDVAYQKSAATCTADAVYYHKCSRCAEKGTTYWTNEGTALGHDMTGYPQEEPTCTDPGHQTCWTCSRSCCKGTFFRDAEGTQLWEGDELIIPATGHDFSQKNASPGYVVVAGNCQRPAVYCFSCSKCGENERNPNHLFFGSSLGDHDFYNPADSDPEHAGISSCRVCGKFDGEEDIIHEEIGYEERTVECRASEQKHEPLFDNNPDTRVIFPSSLLVSFDAESAIDIAGYSFTWDGPANPPSNWVLKGLYPNVGWIVIDTKTDIDPLDGLNFTIDKQPIWYKNFEFEFWGDPEEMYSITDISIKARSPHNLTEHPAVAATCTTAGNEAYWTCSNDGCEDKYFKNEGGTEEWDSEPIIPALGHSYTQQKAEDAYLHSPATCTAQARYYYSCSRCGESEHNASHTFAHGTKLSHTLDADNVCTVCGTKVTATSKAVYNDGTLTFYHDESDHLSDGTVYALNTGTKNPGWYNDRSSITSVVFDENFAYARPTTCYNWFYYCSKLTEITGIENLNTENVTIMSGMFNGCSKLQSLDLSHFNTEAVTSMNNMFYGCSSLSSLDVSKFNTAIVTGMSNMFRDCSSFSSLDVSKFNTAIVTSMGSMFSGCKSLQSLDLTGFNTGMVTSMGSMFYGCNSLQSLDLTGFNTEKVTSMEYMFYGCRSLQSLDLSKFNTEKVTSMVRMFSGCRSLQSLDLSKFNTGIVTNMSEMFYGCESLQSLDLSNFNTEKVTNMSAMFQWCSSLADLDLSSFNTTRVTNMTVMFQNCPSLKTLDFGNFDMQKVTSKYNLFFDNSALKTINFKSVPFVNQYFNTQSLSNDVTVNYELDDNSVIYTGDTNYLPAATSASYTRRGIKNQWGTIVVPFEVGNGADYDLYTLTSVSGNELTLTKVNGTLAANTPALIRLSEAPASPVGVILTAASNAIDATGALTGSSADGLTLTGSYGVKDITDEQGYIISNNKFWDIQTIKGDNHVYCAPFRAYIASTLSGGNSPQMLSINWEEGTLTSVSDLLNALNGDPSTTSEQALEIYDLNGRRIPALQPGANIVKAANGTTRKVFIK